MDTIRGLCIGVSAHQKLDHLQALVRLLGYESVAVFGDCFDEARPRPFPTPPARPVSAPVGQGGAGAHAPAACFAAGRPLSGKLHGPVLGALVRAQVRLCTTAPAAC